MKREEPTKEENCLPMEKPQDLKDALENKKEVKNPMAKSETKLQKTFNNRRTVPIAKKAMKNYEEGKNPVDEILPNKNTIEKSVTKSKKKLHIDQRKRTFNAFKEAFENYAKKKKIKENYEASKLQLKETIMKKPEYNDLEKEKKITKKEDKIDTKDNL